MDFSQLGLQPALVGACESLGYTEPTPIQKQAIPVILGGSDLIGCAETGTGKTAAFLLPLIQRMSEQARPGVRLLVLAPTRELATQIDASYRALAPKKGALRCVNVIGGTGMASQTAGLRRGASVVVATPGRLLDHMERGAVNFATLDALVLDEADRMLDMGFLPSIRRILAAVPKQRQTLLFSATMSEAIEQLARTHMSSPKSASATSPRGWSRRPPTRWRRSRRRRCCSTCWSASAKSSSGCSSSRARGAGPSGSRTSSKRASTRSTASTPTARSRSARPPCAA